FAMVFCPPLDLILYYSCYDVQQLRGRTNVRILHRALNEVIVKDKPDLTIQKLYKTCDRVNLETKSRLNSLDQINSMEELQKRLETIKEFMEQRTKIKEDSLWKRRIPGILARNEMLKKEIAEKKNKFLKSKLISPLKKYIEENNYQKIKDLEGYDKKFKKGNLEILIDKKSSMLRFVLPKWWKAKIEFLFSSRKVSKEFTEIREKLVSLNDWFAEDYFNEVKERLERGNDIVEFADKLYADWKQDKYNLKRIDEIFNEQSRDFADDLLTLEKIADDIEKAVDIYEQAVKTIWLENKHEKHPELDWFMDNRYEKIKGKLDENLSVKLNKGKEYLRNKYKNKQKEKLNSSEGQKIVKLSRRQRKLPSLRKLLNEYSEIIGEILPVWLASCGISTPFKVELPEMTLHIRRHPQIHFGNKPAH
ncbi:hypothetical protein, partial [Halarsenatibacter silvermanii]